MPQEKLEIKNIKLNNKKIPMEFEISEGRDGGVAYVGKVLSTWNKKTPQGTEYVIWNIGSEDGINFNACNGSYVYSLERAVEVYNNRQY